MKKIRLFVFALLAIAMFVYSNSFAQDLKFYDGFTGTGNIGGNCPDATCNNNGWYTHSNTAATTIDIIPGSLEYTGMPAPVGNKVYITGNTIELKRDVNAAVTGLTDVAYFSAFINVLDSTNLGVSVGNYFMHFAETSGNSGVTIFVGKLGIRQGSSSSNFRLGIMNGSGGTFSEYNTDLSFRTTYLVVVKYDRVTNFAYLWVNPTSLGGIEPTANAENNSSTANPPATISSICIRNGYDSGNSAGTPKAYIDEIRVSTTWAGATSTGINEISDISKFQVLPNPSNGKFVIEYAPKTTYNVKIINAIGSVVYSQNNINSSLTLDLSSFNKGIYFVQLNDNNSKAFATRKIVVE